MGKYQIDVLKDSQGNIIRPATITDNVVNPRTRKSVTEDLRELSIKAVQAEDTNDADLDIADDNGNIIVRFEGGGIKTKNFDSSTSPNIQPSDDADLDIADDNGNIIVRFKNGHIKTKNFNSEIRGRKTIKIVAIGNSYARDAYSYVPYILQNVLGAEYIDITIGIVYVGSCTLETHWNNISNNASPYEYDKWTTSSGRWQTTTKNSILSIINDEEWDIVTLQQQSSRSRDYRTMQPFLNNIIDWLFANVRKPIKLGWLMTPAYPQGYSALSNDYGFGLVSDTSDTMFEKICNATQSVLDDTAIDFFIGAGTAIQNARTTTLDSLGDFGHLSAEGLHLQEGIPCLLEAYVVASKILSLIGEDRKGIYGDNTRPTQENVVAWNVPQRNGDSVGVTEANVRLVQKIVSVAIKKPFIKTDCGALFE